MYRIDRAREMCAQIGLGDAIMMYKQPENRVEARVWVVGGGLPKIWRCCDRVRSTVVRGKPSDKPERRGGLLVVITQRWNVKKTMLRWWGG